MDWVLRSARSIRAKNSSACKLSDLLFKHIIQGGPKNKPVSSEVISIG